MASFVKAKLKASRDAIQAKDWSTAVQCADEVLEYEADNYNAHVFKALAVRNQNDTEGSEALYRKAIALQPSKWLAWQGLEKLLTETEQWQRLMALLVEMMDRAKEADDATRCAEALQKLVDLQREHGSSAELAATLSYYLPTSPYFNLLSTLPEPDQTNPEATTTFAAQMAIHTGSLSMLMEVIILTEKAEGLVQEREVDRRKNRLDSMAKGKDAVRNEVGLEIWSTSHLPDLYEQVSAHVQASDEQRREAERKLLLYRLQILQALPIPDAQLAGPSGNAASTATAAAEREQQQRRKAEVLKIVQEQAHGMVSINVAEETAWSIVLEWQDTFYLTDLDRLRLRAYIDHFPRSGLSRSFEALLLTVKDEQFLKEQEERRKEADVERVERDPLTLALDGLEAAPRSLLAHRIAAALYLADRDWTSASETATAALQLARRLEAQLAIKLDTGVKPSLEAILALSLTHIHAPQHHPRALRLCGSVLSVEPHNVEALMANAAICQAALKWDEAKSLYGTLEQVDDTNNGNADYQAQRTLSPFAHPGRDARLESAWCDVQLGHLDTAEGQLRAILVEMETHEVTTNSIDHAKAHWRLGQCLWQMGGHHRTDRDQAFSCFITALKRDAAYAPAFTSLGLYYADVVQPADLQRAAKCFQKAFELDARQDEAARRLAESYAEEEDWDLVELVARRMIEAEGGAWVLQGKAPTQARRHTTANAWAWHAIGSTELIRNNHEKAIVALQVALRNFPDQQHIWMRLGDAYLASGRHSAAIKTYERARQLQSDQDAWQSLLCIANVQTEMAMYEEAIALYDVVIKDQPQRLPIRIARAEVRFLLAMQQARQGYVDRARMGMRSVVVEGVRVLQQHRTDAAAWKLVADALLQLSRMEDDEASDEFVRVVVSKLVDLVEQLDVDRNLPSVTSATAPRVRYAIKALASSSKTSISAPRTALRLAAALLCKVRILLVDQDAEMTGSAWMDLSVALYDVCQDLRLRVAEDVVDDDVVEGIGAELVDDALSQSVTCAQEALKLEPGRGAFWCALGVLVFDRGVALAQHCFIRAIECDGKDTVAWTNLGYLFLANDDLQLAHQAFLRARTIDPEQTYAWIGQAIAQQQEGDHDASRALFQHAYAIDQMGLLEAGYGFAASTLTQQRKSGDVRPALLNDASAALSAYLAQRPSDVSALHLAALFAEAQGEDDLASEQIEAAADILEHQYEEEEATGKAQLFGICMANLGRIHLACQRYDLAIEKTEMCLGLLGSNSGNDATQSGTAAAALSSDDLIRAQMNAHCTIGLAHFAQGEADLAVSSLRDALEDLQMVTGTQEAQERLVCLLAQIQWSQGQHEEAETTLLEHLANAPQSRHATVLLGAVSWLLDSQDQLEAVQADLQETLQQPPSAGQIDETAQREAVWLLSSLALFDGQTDQALTLLSSGNGGSATDGQVHLVDTLLQLAKQATTEEQRHHWSQLAQRESVVLWQRAKAADDEAALTTSARLSTITELMRADLRANDGADSSDPVHVTVAPTPKTKALQAVYLDPSNSQSWHLLADASTIT